MYDIPPLFGDKSRTIRLDDCGDSTPRYAIYQLQTQRLAYKVYWVQFWVKIYSILFWFQKIGTWMKYSGNGAGVLDLNRFTLPMESFTLSNGQNGTKCLPECKEGEKLLSHKVIRCVCKKFGKLSLGRKFCWWLLSWLLQAWKEWDTWERNKCWVSKRILAR